MLKDLPDLVKSGIITQESSDKIRDYYLDKKKPNTTRLFIVFGILGAILIGLGIILIIAHNWDEFSKLTKTFFAFLPLIIAQIIAGFTILKKSDSISWKESSAILVFFTIGASISMVSQIYNIPGDISSFLLTWMALAFPLIYLLNSSTASLLFIIGITTYACQTSYWTYPSSDSYSYWLMIAGVFPYYYKLLKKVPGSNFVIFHNWLISLSVVIVLGTLANDLEDLMFIAYMSLFGLLYLIGDQKAFLNQHIIKNAYKLIGSLGTIILLLFLSFNFYWEEMNVDKLLFSNLVISPEFYISLLISLSAIGLIMKIKLNSVKNLNPISLVFILFILTFTVGVASPEIAVILINLSVFIIGILTIINGVERDHLGLLNFGLLMITALIICRFFDTDISFFIRGVLFVVVGAGFFMANYWMLRKRKTNE